MRFIIDFFDSTPDNLIREYITVNDLTILETFSAFNKTYVVDCDSKPPITSIVDVIVEDEVNPVSLLGYPIASGDKYPRVSLDPSLADNWWKVASCNNVNLARDSVIERRGASATVYVVDSGVMSSHPDLLNVDIFNLYSFNADFNDYNGHGTAIASLISGEKCGLTNARIKSVKIFQKGVPTLQSHLLAAFDAIIQDITTNKNTFPIVNLSWALAKNSFIENKIKLLIVNGAMVVTSAGNSGIPIENVTPASMPEVCTVGAYGQNFKPCSFSNYTGSISTTAGETNYGALDVWAPGEDLKIATLDGGYGYAAGTSLATAIHSAAVAYNSISCVLSDGSVPASVPQDLSYITTRCTHRPDMLIFDDAKYSNSKNLCTMFKVIYDGDGATYTHVSKYNAIVTAGKPFERLMFSPLTVKSWTIADTLPVGLRIDNGWIVGSVEVTEPTLFQTSITYEKFSGVIINATMTLLMAPENANLATSDIDPQIVVKLQFLCDKHMDFTGIWYCYGACSGGWCHDICNLGNPKDQWSIYCNCGDMMCPL